MSGMYLSSIGKRVLFLDLDPQASLTHRLIEGKPKKTVYNLLAENENIFGCILEINPTLSIIAGELRVNIIYSGVIEKTLKMLFKKLSFDYIILDNPPSWNSLVIAGLSASDFVCIPSLLSQNDFDSVQFTLSEIKKIDDNLKALIILNRATKKETREENEYLEMYKFHYPIYRFPISTSVKKVLDRKESLDLKKHYELKKIVSNMLSIKDFVL
jgi:chromosome partitioning protein